jgi:transcriptional regulator NrdR family protein
MDCPLCGGGTTVCDSRPEIDCVNRKRRCLSCDHRFATIELETDMLQSWQNSHTPAEPVKAIDVEGVKKAVRLLNTFLEEVKND